MISKEKQEKVGDKDYKKGKEEITTSIFNWSKDYASGATHFTQALKHYQAASHHEKCLKTLEKLIQCNQSMMDNWALARNHQAILEIYLNHYPETSNQKLSQVAEKGFLYFKMAEAVDKGLTMLSKLAKHLLKQGNLKQATTLLSKAYQQSLQTQKSFKTNEIFSQMVNTYLENDLYSEVQKMYKNHIIHLKGVNCNQNGLIMLIMIIIQHEPKRTEKQMYELSNLIPAFLESDQAEAADELVKAYKKGDDKMFMKWTTKAAITTIFPVTIIRKLREMKVPTQIAEEEANKEDIGNLLF